MPSPKRYDTKLQLNIPTSPQFIAPIEARVEVIAVTGFVDVFIIITVSLLIVIYVVYAVNVDIATAAVL